jgi:hypothetical protein
LDAREHNLKAGAPQNVREAAFLSFPFFCLLFFWGSPPERTTLTADKLEAFGTGGQRKVS